MWVCVIVGKKKGGKDDKSYVFWDTQPVPKLSEKPAEHGPIENKKLDEVSAACAGVAWRGMAWHGMRCWAEG